MRGFLIAIEPWANAGLAILWRASWQGALVLAVAWGIARWCTFLSPRAVCWVWRLACLKLLVALVWAQPLTIPVWSPETNAVVAMPDGSNPPAVSADVANRAPVERAAPTAVDAPVAHGGNWASALVPVLLLLFWLVGVAARSARSVLQWRAVQRLCGSAAGSPVAAVCELLAREADRLRVKRLPRLCVSPQTRVPLMAGAWRPMILLPEQVDTHFAIGELRLMLAHELAHVKRHDLAWNWQPTVVDCLFFFHPLVWLMTRCWSESQEAACDELLIERQVAAPVEYGRLLIKLAALRPQQRHPQLVVAGVLGTYQNLEKRILTMARVKPSSFRRLAVTLTLLLLAAAPGIIPWRLVPRDQQRSLAAAEPTAPVAAPAAGAAPALLGKIYADMGLQTKNAAGETEKISGVIAIDPKTGAWQKLGDWGSSLRVSPAGDRIAYSDIKPSKAPGQKRRPSESFVADLKTMAAVSVADPGSLPIWSPDGKALLYHVPTLAEDNTWHGATWLVDLATKQTRTLPIPAEDEVDDWTGHGDWMVTVSDRHPPFGHGYQLYVMHPDGSGQRRITEGKGLNCYPRFRPDGQQIVYNHQGGGHDSIWVVDIDGGNRRKILSDDDEGHNAPNGAHWSPDGTWLAVYLFNWQTDIPGVANPGKKRLRGAGIPSDVHIEIVAADGTQQRRLKLEGVSQIDWINSVDWH